MGELARFSPVTAGLDLLAHPKQNTIDVPDDVIEDLKTMEANGHRCVEIIGKLLHRIHTLQDQHYPPSLIQSASWELSGKLQNYFATTPRELEVLRHLWMATIYPALDLSATVEAIRQTNIDLAKKAREACPTVVSIASISTDTTVTELMCSSPGRANQTLAEWLGEHSVERWYALPIWVDGIIRFTATFDELNQ